MTTLYFAVPSPGDAPTTSTVPVTTTTTTTSTTTTTTLPPTTTTHPSTTSTTTRHPTTTTHPSTTTSTTAAPVSHHGASTPWGLIAVVAALALAIVVVTVLLVARRSRARAGAWRRAVLPALSDARLARDALLSGNAEADDEQLRAAVSLQVDRAAAALEGSLDQAPEPVDADLARSVAGALRGLAFAVEADRLLRHGAAAPTGAQLAAADQARRDRSAELDRGLARLAARIGRGQKHPPR